MNEQQELFLKLSHIDAELSSLRAAVANLPNTPPLVYKVEWGFDLYIGKDETVIMPGAAQIGNIKYTLDKPYTPPLELGKSNLVVVSMDYEHQHGSIVTIFSSSKLCPPLTQNERRYELPLFEIVAFHSSLTITDLRNPEE